ncbi:MAG: hypothetical protein Q9167_003070 [Letrouitia subvulpina]
MFSRVVVSFTVICALAAMALAAPPTTTNPMQTLMGIQSLDPVQESVVDDVYYREQSAYQASLATGLPGVVFTALVAAPSSARRDMYSDPGFFFASLAQAQPSNRPSWFNAMPTEVQGYYSSVGRANVEMYTREVKAVNPSAVIEAPISSVISSISSKIESDVRASASNDAHTAATMAAKTGNTMGPRSVSSSMSVAVAGVVLAASLIGLAML